MEKAHVQLIIVLLAAVCQVGAKVKVVIYYESLCPDSTKFITRQLHPTYQRLGSVIEPVFVPFGKAHYRRDPWQIDCQHGPDECYGNAVQACMLNSLKTDRDKEAFVNCVMGSSKPDQAGPKCAKALSLSYWGIESCANGTLGQELIAQHGDRTHNFFPPILFIPTIAIEDKYSVSNQMLAKTNFKRLICKQFSDPKPKGCFDDAAADNDNDNDNDAPIRAFFDFLQ